LSTEERFTHWNNINLNTILSNQNSALTFREFLHEIKCAENLYFWLEVEDYKNIPNGIENHQDHRIRAEAIWSKFFSSHRSEYFLNVDDGLKAELFNNIQNDTIDGTLFDRIQQWIEFLMTNDCLPKFLRSDKFRIFKENDGIMLPINNGDNNKNSKKIRIKKFKKKKSQDKTNNNNNNTVNKTHSVMLLENHVKTGSN